VASINGFIATHAVNEMLARLHPFRRDSNEEFRYQVFSLSDGAWLRLSDGQPCRLLSRDVVHPDLEAHLMTIAGQDNPRASLFPSLAGRKTGGAHGLSKTFSGIMENASIRADAARQ
jgi:uncharacterized protein (DUF58 family)